MERTVLVIGAHPDDADIRAGGFACRLAQAGHEVIFVSMTDGRAGHHEQGGIELVERRRAEAAAAADIAGIDYCILKAPDGRLRPTLERRERLIRLIRRLSPDLVLTHRPNDYHPDHRYTSQLVRDAAYMVTGPNVCPGTPALDSNPVFAYLLDTFDRPHSFDPDVVIPIPPDLVDRKYKMLDCHESQVYEWLPYNAGIIEEVPDDPDRRREWLETDPLASFAEMQGAADRLRDRLEGDVEYAEAFEISEYGAELDDELTANLFE
ncbi:PIG-L deacetylase family protein [Saliphagus infecundisoli]|uniref:PIG-L deacetylase family protein n=1 Tax=Saliphagus infecundisoli TaxID=1849069 RepID=A0ABD5QAJ6_9EURY|nr:PIG-L family deacetylase [Saliphagus infecundisoli]